ncbi:hypothetical protein NKH77_31340 [Streptomyces sp. M19]
MPFSRPRTGRRRRAVVPGAGAMAAVAVASVLVAASYGPSAHRSARPAAPTRGGC